MRSLAFCIPVRNPQISQRKCLFGEGSRHVELDHFHFTRVPFTTVLFLRVLL